ncbi:NCS1 family nucleobase:cation symporter-1 [uncultured Shewanella sp.]|uniref:NCS1 family nucleobase:cation symporter-1 n=1 Tax=uncultured Shewanella sp. TaxID=173975 RepID=UPI0026210595|nr:NCS1 family nucleobase:cation symporter-1 [uncultured Shewanella sp.]
MVNKVSQPIKTGLLYELEIEDDVLNSAYFNHDIAPTKTRERTWTKWHVAALWVGMAICVPTYTLGGVLTSFFGLNVKEALLTILLANIVILIPLTLNACAGTKYGIPFPVLLRSSFGILGSNLPCLIRGIVACGWFGIQTLFGGIAIHILLSHLLPGWESLEGKGEVVGFFLFLFLNIYIVIKGSESIKVLESLSAPILLAVGLGLMMWAYPQVSVTELLAEPAKRPENASFWPYFFGGLTAMVGFWATLSLNIPDFSRYARSQKDQILGQIIGLPVTMFFFASLGVVLTAASQGLVGETISDPVNLIGKIDNPIWVVIAMLFIIIATLSTNTAANVVSPTNDFQNIAPKKINHTKGVLLTGLIGFLLMSYDLVQRMGWVNTDFKLEDMYSNWLLGYSSLLGPIAGIMIVDYFIIRKRYLNLPELYKAQGLYKGVRFQGMFAFIFPVCLTLIAVNNQAFSWFYHYGWFTGSILGGITYYLLCQITSAKL